jgi:glycosyltransferase involved in cell wall biosynthesis
MTKKYKWSIGMPSFNNFDEVFYTIEALRMYHDLKDCEIIVVDNFGDEKLERFCRSKGEGLIRYERFTEKQGTAAPRNHIFEIAKGEFVLCMDSHVFLQQGFFKNDPIGDGLTQGPIVWTSFKGYSTEWENRWGRNMWGIWKETVKKLPKKSFKIWGQGLGIFCCRRDAWLGFNNDFRGFGGEEGYIHEKYRKAGKKVWCDPSKIWLHQFCNGGRIIPYPVHLPDRIRNYFIGFKELGLDPLEVEKHFDPEMVLAAKNIMKIDELNDKIKTLELKISGYEKSKGKKK